MHHQKRFVFIQDIGSFLRHFIGLFSKDPQRRAQAVTLTCNDLRLKGVSETKISTFEDILLDIAEASGNWLQYLVVENKVATGLLAVNLLLLPITLSWGKPDNSSGIALIALAISSPFIACYLLIRFTQEDQKVGRAGCGLTFMQVIFALGTVVALVATLWHVFPPAGIVFTFSAFVALILWIFNLTRGAIIAAHIRRRSSSHPIAQQIMVQPNQHEKSH